MPASMPQSVLPDPDSDKIEEIRRTIFIANIDKSVSTNMTFKIWWNTRSTSIYYKINDQHPNPSKDNVLLILVALLPSLQQVSAEQLLSFLSSCGEVKFVRLLDDEEQETR